MRALAMVYGYIVFSRFQPILAAGVRAPEPTSARSMPPGAIENDTPGASSTRRGTSRTVSRSSGFRRAGGSVMTRWMRPDASSRSSSRAPSSPTANTYTIRPLAR